MYTPQTTSCPHCRKPLPWLERMKGENFCTPEHRHAYLTQLDSAILNRLGAKKPILPIIRKPLVKPRQPVTALVVARADA